MLKFLKPFVVTIAPDAVHQPQPATAKPSQPAKAPAARKPHPHKPSRNHQPFQAIRCPDMLALVAFDQEARLVSPFVNTFDAAFAASVVRLPSYVRGSITDMAAGLRLANDLLARQPRGLLRRIWLLTDGHPNPPDQPIWQEVTRARKQRTNINTIGFGEPGGFDADLLKRIAAVTHNGRYGHARDLDSLTATFRKGAKPRKAGAHRGEATVFVIDVSGSMSVPMGSQRAIDAVAAAMINLLKYKQHTWS